MSDHDSKNQPILDRLKDEPPTHAAWDQLFELLARDMAKRLKANAVQADVARARAAGGPHDGPAVGRAQPLSGEANDCLATIAGWRVGRTSPL